MHLGLSERALQKNQLRWRERPKIHQMHHVQMSYLPLNPKTFSNFLNEDFIRRVKKRASTSHPMSVSKTVLLKYVLTFCLRWRQY